MSTGFEQVPISQAMSVLQFSLLACSICRESLWFPHSSFSAVNLPMSDGINVNWLVCNQLSTKKKINVSVQFAFCWLALFAEHAFLLPHSVIRAVNLPMSDGIDVNWLLCK
jgi:hypothetical protein